MCIVNGIHSNMDECNKNEKMQNLGKISVYFSSWWYHWLFLHALKFHAFVFHTIFRSFIYGFSHPFVPERAYNNLQVYKLIHTIKKNIQNEKCVSSKLSLFALMFHIIVAQSGAHSLCLFIVLGVLLICRPGFIFACSIQWNSNQFVCFFHLLFSRKCWN